MPARSRARAGSKTDATDWLRRDRYSPLPFGWRAFIIPRITLVKLRSGGLGYVSAMPVLASYYAFRKSIDKDTRLMRQASRLYAPALGRAVRFPFVTAGLAVALFAVSIFIVPFLETNSYRLWMRDPQLWRSGASRAA
jgi:hypothetical protein